MDRTIQQEEERDPTYADKLKSSLCEKDPVMAEKCGLCFVGKES